MSDYFKSRPATFACVRWLSFLLCLGFLYIQAVAKPVSIGQAKHVIIDKTRQVLFAYEGNRLVFSSRISTGRKDTWTPNGDFHAGEKSLMHYSTLFEHAPMPYSVQVNGDIFIHGFADVPSWPASHGCIRMPLTGDNPARTFYNWVDIGTPIHIQGKWSPATLVRQKLVIAN